MSLNDLLGAFSLFTVSFAFNLFLLTFIFFYLIFAFITLRQTQLMSQILNLLNFSPFLKLVAAIHFLASIALFILALISLLF